MLHRKPFSNDQGQTMLHTSKRPKALTFIPRPGFTTQTLACMLDSLVRVSRRVEESHFPTTLTLAGIPPLRTHPDPHP